MDTIAPSKTRVDFSNEHVISSCETIEGRFVFLPIDVYKFAEEFRDDTMQIGSHQQLKFQDLYHEPVEETYRLLYHWALNSIQAISISWTLSIGQDTTSQSGRDYSSWQIPQVGPIHILAHSMRLPSLRSRTLVKLLQKEDTIAIRNPEDYNHSEQARVFLEIVK